MNKTTILSIHGGGKGAYKEDKKLAASLQNALKDYNIHYPKMPKEDDPNYELYKTKIEKELNKIKHDVILGGHSVGACFLLKYLAETKISKQITGVFLISTPFWSEGGWQYEGFTLNNMLASEQTINISVFFYHSTDDEIVPFSHLSLYKEKFAHAAFRKINNRGHQLKNDVSEIVQDIKSLFLND